MTQSHTPRTGAPTAFADLNATLAQLVDGARAALGDNFVGAYLHGSFALGGADAASDVDWLIAVREAVTEPRLAALQAVHGALHDGGPRPWAQRLEGSYVPLAQLRRFTAPAEEWLYLDNGARALERSTHDNTRVVRWTLREKGVVLAGPEARDLIDPVTPEDLALDVRGVFRVLASDWLPRPARIDRRWLPPFFVTLAARMLHTLATGEVHAKAASTAWALGQVEPRWRPVLQRALDQRQEPLERKLAPADRADVAETLAFLRYAMRRAAPPPARSVPPASHGHGARWGPTTGPTAHGRPPLPPMRPGSRRGRG